MPGESAAVSTVAFDRHRYDSLTPQDRHVFFIAMLLDGLEKCARFHEVSLSEMKQAIEKFRGGGYRNEWVCKKRELRSVGLRAWLLCSLDPTRFSLALRLGRQDVVIFEQQILETKPDELIFSHRFSDLVEEGQILVVKDRFGEATFSLDLAPFL